MVGYVFTTTVVYESVGLTKKGIYYLPKLGDLPQELHGYLPLKVDQNV